jgi:hypothetical protein
MAKTIASAITIGSGGSAGREGPHHPDRRRHRLAHRPGHGHVQAPPAHPRRLRRRRRHRRHLQRPHRRRPLRRRSHPRRIRRRPVRPHRHLLRPRHRRRPDWRGNETASAPPARTFASALGTAPLRPARPALRTRFLCLYPPQPGRRALLRGIANAAPVAPPRPRRPPRRPARARAAPDHGRWPLARQRRLRRTLPGARAVRAPLFAKMLATALTLGSGGSGGVFSPALAIGALLGAGSAASPNPGSGPISAASPPIRSSAWPA